MTWRAVAGYLSALLLKAARLLLALVAAQGFYTWASA